MIDKSKVFSIHLHSQFSPLDGLSSIEEIVDKAVENGQVAAAITDHGVMDGCIPFYLECQKKGIKPILGQEFYVAPEGRLLTDKDKELDRYRFHLIVLAKNEVGYRNLCKLSSIAMIKGFYYKPRIDLPTLFKYKEGLIISSACYASQLSKYLNDDEWDKARAYCNRMRDEFGDDFYIEEVWLRPTGIENPADKEKGLEPIVVRQNRLNAKATKLSKELGIKRILTTDSHYTNKEDQAAHETLVAIGTGDDFNDENRLSFIDFWENIPSPEEMIEYAESIDDLELLTSQGEIADKVNLQLNFIGEHHFPAFPTENQMSEKDYLKKLVVDGIKRRNYCNYNQTKKLPENVQEKIRMELKIIDDMGYNGYHLIVQDYVMWAKTHGVVVGPGRGSAAASLVCYLLGITEIDPMQYDDLMMFQRYLNPHRISFPDIDTDFSDRQAVEDYFKERWGQENTAAIATTLYMRAKNAFKDTARTFKFPFQESNRIANLIPDTNLGRKDRKLGLIVYGNEETPPDPTIAEEIRKNPELKKIFDLAIKLEGTVRGHGVHACGVVVAPKPLTNYMGLSIAKGKDGRVVTQADPADIEGTYGLLKMDMLGLSNLTVLQETIEKIKRDTGKDLSVENIPLDDEKTFDTFSEGNSYFTFQFNTSYVRSICKGYKPRNMRDLAWITAVCRPGPMSFIPEMIKIRNGEKKQTYICEAAKEIFDPTGGYPVFQESVMKFCMQACGFSESEADKVRKAMAKSKPTELSKYREDFISGYLKHTNPNQKKEIEEFWESLAGFSKYAFNASHALCYAHIGYWTCYFLTNYPEYYLSSYMNVKSGDKTVLAEVISYCKKMNITIKAPDVNYSTRNFQPDAKNHIIYYGLSTVKGIGASALAIIEERKKNGKFHSIEDLISRIERRNLNSGKLTALLFSGGLDSFVNGKRSILVHNIDNILEYQGEYFKRLDRQTKAKEKQVKNKEISLFDELFGTPDEELRPIDLKRKNNMILPKLELVRPEKYTEEMRIEIFMKEKEYLGEYVSGNPINSFERNVNWKDEISEQKIENSDRIIVRNIVAVIQEVKHTVTKKNKERMAMFKGDALEAAVDVVVFPQVFDNLVRHKQDLKEGQVVLFSGRYTEDEEETTYRFIAENIKIIKE